MLSLSQILTPQTSAQVRAQMVVELNALGIPADRWIPGGVASSLLTVAAIVLAMFSTQMSNFVSGFFLPVSSGAFLQLLATYVYGVTVPQATFASGSYTLVNTGGGIYPYAAGGFFVQNAVTGQTYANTAPFTLAATSTLTIQIQATTAGTVGNANPGDVSILVTALLAVTGTNSTSIVGIDTPTDPQIRQLCLNSLGVRSVRGPRTAYAYSIQTATNPITGNPVNINRWTVAPDHSGNISVTVAAPSGVTDPNDVEGVATSIEALARPEGTVVSVNAATGVGYLPVLTPWVLAPAGVAPGDLLAAIGTAVSNFMGGPQNPIGGITASDDLHPGGFTGLLGGSVVAAAAVGVATIPGCTLVSLMGATDLALLAGQVAVDSISLSTPQIIPVRH
jgi:hypothetical protein